MVFLLGSSIGPIGIVLYSLLAALFWWKLRGLVDLLNSVPQTDYRELASSLSSWAFRPRNRRLAEITTNYPFLIAVLTALAGMSGWFTVLTILHFNVPFLAVLLGALFFTFPLYRAADAFEALFLLRVARNIDPNSFSKQDVNLLSGARKELRLGCLYFASLAILFSLVMYFLTTEGQLLEFPQYQYVGVSVFEVTSLALFALVTLIATFLIYQLRPMEE